MGQRGPKPLPSNVHRMRGNPSKKARSELTDAVQPEVAIPMAPDHLLPEAKKEWRRISKELKLIGLVTKIDRAALAAYCQAWGRWVEAERKLKELGDYGLVETTPSGYKQMGVWLQISNRALDQMKSFMAEFGMSPSSRSRVTASPQLDMFPDDNNSSSAKTPDRFFSGG
ncbi:MAG: phage terminase small subunit P27 family [Candidatus Thiodiazotropha sp. (ex Epidulcina cf. delphinae)]|nr:phage terminase small subunit P27 family [Candidatus Thiodiazotropha sp. (ex Epidulcina cf. delphinae)]